MLLTSRCTSHLPPTDSCVHPERAENGLFLQVPVFRLEELANIRYFGHRLYSLAPCCYLQAGCAEQRRTCAEKPPLHPWAAGLCCLHALCRHTASKPSMICECQQRPAIPAAPTGHFYRKYIHITSTHNRRDNRNGGGRVYLLAHTPTYKCSGETHYMSNQTVFIYWKVVLERSAVVTQAQSHPHAQMCTHKLFSLDFCAVQSLGVKVPGLSPR